MLRDRGDAPGGPDAAPDRGAAGGTAERPDVATVVEALRARGAAGIPHPGGTLLAHLERVHALLTEWGARPALRLAGLCHAFYGTDGFPAALGDATRRDELTAIIGEEAERLVYFYAACDRRVSHPHMADRDGAYKDRFTGAVSRPPLASRRDFAELTAANELDIMRVNADLRARHREPLLRLFAAWRDLLSARAWQAVSALPRGAEPPPEG
ncbi:MAG TPA: hypothetical protein VF069_14425 [Streptosporangiaceae bacterium]